jgi:hypothetical protein
MSNLIKKVARNLLRKPLKRIVGSVQEEKLEFGLDLLEQNVRNLNLQRLHLLYPHLHDHKTFLRDREAKVYSQNGEDGFLLYILSKIGTTNKRFVEFGVEDGRECNTANLAINFGWNGLLLECDEKQVAKARQYYKSLQEIKPDQVKIYRCFVTAENINHVLKLNEFDGSLDLLSIDIDGNDYWVWKAITVVDPRVVVIEYNAILGNEKSLTAEYDPEFIRYKKHKSGLYHGASLNALTRLANSKGYGLVGCESSGANAFFVRKELLSEQLKEVSVKEAYYPHYRRSKSETMAEQFARIKHLNWIQVNDVSLQKKCKTCGKWFEGDQDHEWCEDCIVRIASSF